MDGASASDGFDVIDGRSKVLVGSSGGWERVAGIGGK